MDIIGAKLAGDAQELEELLSHVDECGKEE
jgi:hypothetical protein